MTFALLVQARVANGMSLHEALADLKDYSARTLYRHEDEEKRAERERRRIARMNTENLKKLGGLLKGK
jgi:DNA replication protein DnaC